MRDTQPQPVYLRTLPRWVALALILAGCLNPRPEELPSAQDLDAPGSPGAGDGDENLAIEPPPPTPADPGVSIDEESPSSPDPNDSQPAIDADGGGPNTRTDAGAPDASD